MKSADLLRDGFGRVHQEVHAVLAGLPVSVLTARIAPQANTLSWLVWHLTRVQDDHVAGVAGREQLWTSAGWADRFGLPFPRGDTGYGQGVAEVGQVRAGSDLLLGYYDAVHEATLRFVGGLTDRDLDRIVDEGWDPPVTLGVRLVSVLSDDLQHVGQAAYARGILLG
ncbi:MAG: hypothetical protein JWL64_494 [Frankiales bacterium]|nr:hypothetical protein [Frankiales bacterium]